MSGWPQIVLFALFVAQVSLHIAKNGEIRTNGYDRYSGWRELFSYALTSWLLYEGGFWS